MILVTGATGLNGRELVQLLSARGARVRAMVRNRKKADSIAALPGVEVVEGDLARLDTLVEPLRGVERAMLISSSDPAMLEVQSTFVEAARRAGLAHIVKLSGIMPELDSPFRFARMHGEIEACIERSGLTFTHLRAGEFMHSYFRQVPAIVGKSALMLPMEDARIASIDVGDIAEISARVLTSSGHENRIYRLTGGEAQSMSEVAAILTRVTGKPIRYIDVPPEDARKAHLAAGIPPFLADALFELFAERRRGKESRVFPDAETILGRPQTSFADFAAKHAAIFRGEQPPPRV